MDNFGLIGFARNLDNFPTVPIISDIGLLSYPNHIFAKFQLKNIQIFSLVHAVTFCKGEDLRKI